MVFESSKTPAEAGKSKGPLDLMATYKQRLKENGLWPEVPSPASQPLMALLPMGHFVFQVVCVTWSKQDSKAGKPEHVHKKDVLLVRTNRICPQNGPHGGEEWRAVVL